MPYNFDAFHNQLSDLQRQYQQLQAQQPQPIPQLQPVQVPVPPRQVQYVEGISGAKLYQQNLPSNSSEIIMDKEDNIFYMVSKDANGTPARKIPVGRFSLEEYVEDEPTFITRKDFDELKKEIMEILTAPDPKPAAKTSSKSKE